MKRHIDKPYKINLKVYISIGLMSEVALFVSVFYNDFMGSKISDIVKNMSIGCLASVIVALIIEIGNNKERNMNANTVYDLVYDELQNQILFYISTWAHLCSIAFPKLECSQERHTWSEWYEITKINFIESDDSTQVELISLFKSELLLNIDGIEKAILKIENQQYILEIDRLLNNELNYYEQTVFLYTCGYFEFKCNPANGIEKMKQALQVFEILGEHNIKAQYQEHYDKYINQ